MRQQLLLGVQLGVADLAPGQGQEDVVEAWPAQAHRLDRLRKGPHELGQALWWPFDEERMLAFDSALQTATLGFSLPWSAT